MNRRCWHS